MVFKFPLYRFGLAFISSFIIILFVNIFVDNKRKIENKKILSILLITTFTLICVKNIKRIYINLDQEYQNAPWPAIYSMNVEDKNKKIEFDKIYDEKNEIMYFFSRGKECMYSKSPCTNLEIKNIKNSFLYNYKIYYFE